MTEAESRCDQDAVKNDGSGRKLLYTNGDERGSAQERKRDCSRRWGSSLQEVGDGLLEELKFTES